MAVLVLSSLLAMVVLSLGGIAHVYGHEILLPKSLKIMRLNAEEVDAQVAQHTFLHVGGPHRGGTTILWSLLKEHPGISGFKDKVGVDFAEGMFLQSVYPTMGVGAEVGVWGKRKAAPSGMGQYAFNPDNRLDEHCGYVLPEARQMMFNEWGFFWNLNRPVLLEKTPPNMIISRFLQALWSASYPTMAHLSSAKQVHFVFMTRHPIANALAHQQHPPCNELSMDELVEHWVEQHEILYEDLPHLKSASVVRFEDFVQDPDRHLAEVYRAVGLDPASARRTIEVRRDTNDKYFARYCAQLLRDERAHTAHTAMAAEYNRRVRRLGYDISLESLPCSETSD